MRRTAYSFSLWARSVSRALGARVQRRGPTVVRPDWSCPWSEASTRRSASYRSRILTDQIVNASIGNNRIDGGTCTLEDATPRRLSKRPLMSAHDWFALPSKWNGWTDTAIPR